MNELYSQAKRRRQGLVGSGIPQRNGNDENDLFGSQFSVPSSQAPSQRRYLSQRSNLQQSQAVRTGRRAPANYYESVLVMAGLSLDEPGGVVVLKCEPIVFMHKLKSVLRTNPEYPSNVDRFIAGIELVTKDRTNFLKLLECCQVVPTVALGGPSQTQAGTGGRKPVQESLMKMFLLVDFLQLKLIELLFAYLLKEVEASTAGDESAGTEDSVVGFVLSQLKFIDHVQNGEVVFEKVFQLLAKTKRDTVIFDEIIFSLEDVIDVSKHDEALHRLMKLRPRPEDIITPTTVEVFTQMCLSVETLELLRRKVVQYAADGCQLRYYPALVKMLLKFNRSEPPENVAGIVREVRKLLDPCGNGEEAWSSGGATADDCAEHVLRTVFQAISASIALFDCWIATIRQLPAAEDHLPVDLLILTVATTINELKAARIRKLTIKKIEQQFFIDAHTDQLVSGCFRRVLQAHLDGFLQLIECCTRERTEHVCEFGVAAMGALFSLDQTLAAADNRVVLSKIVGFICEMASGNVGNRNDYLIGRCISALRKLHESHPKTIERSAELLLKILDIAPELSLRQYRPLIGVIYAAAIPLNSAAGDGDDAEASTIRDNLEIIVKKQLLCDSKDTKRKGIIGLVQMVYHMSLSARSPDGPGDEQELSCSFDSERTIGTVSEIPSARGRTLANLISTLFLSTNQSPDLLAICYDELAGMLAQVRPKTAPPWEKTFIMWLCDTVTMDFQSHCLVEDGTALPGLEPSRDGTTPGIKLARLLCINPGEEASANIEAATIALNIGCGVLGQRSRHAAISFLAPIFRLMRTLHGIRYEGSLESINALLGCAIVVPDFYGNPEEEDRRFSVDAYDEGRCTQLLDIYFYLGNWFRECISAFVTQPDMLIRGKVLNRLRELVKLEHHVGRMLDRLATDCEYIPPLAADLMEQSAAARGGGVGGGAPSSSAVFRKPGRPVRESRGRRPKPTAGHDKTINLDEPLGSQTVAATLPATVGQFNERSILLRCPFAVRQMDPALACLLEVPLKPVRVFDPAPKEACLALPEYRFVLENLTLAVEQTEHETCQRPVLDRWSEFITRTAVLREELREGTDRLQPASPQELLPLKSCYLWSLRLATALLSWRRFREQRGRADLERVVAVMVRKFCDGEDQEGAEHFGDHVRVLLKELIVRESCFGDLSIAAQIYRLARALGECTGEGPVAVRALARFTRSVLTATDLRTPDAKSNQHFLTLLEGLMSSISMKALGQLVVEMRQDICLEDAKAQKTNSGDGNSAASAASVRTFASFKRPHYAHLFKGLCRAFIRLLQDEIRIRAGTGGPTRRLELWEMACGATGELTNVVRRAQQAGNFSVYLRFAQIFIKLFLRSGLPVLEAILRSSAERASNILSTLQITTRYLHSICCQAKISRGSGGAAAAVSQIPFVRESVETLVYRVKAALVANHCSAVFWMGNLKNKDMQGELIASQLEPEPDTDDEEATIQDDTTLSEDDHVVGEGGADETSEQDAEPAGSRLRKGPAKAKKAARSTSGSSVKSSQSKCF